MVVVVVVVVVVLVVVVVVVDVVVGVASRTMKFSPPQKMFFCETDFEICFMKDL